MTAVAARAATAGPSGRSRGETTATSSAIFNPRSGLCALLCLACLALLAGCAAEPSRQTIPAEQLSQANTQADLASLKSRVQEMRVRIDELESVQGKAGRGVTLDEVNRRLALLEETVSRMAATLGVESGSRAPSPSSSIGGAPGGPARAGSPDYDPEAPPVAPIAMGQAGNDPAEAILNMAMESFNQHDYSRANSLFSELLKSYPTSRQAPNALFWQAETNFQQGDYARAALICQDLIQKFPNHPLVPSTMLKQALSFRKLGKLQAARILLQDVEKRYPGTPEARSAQTQLRDLR
ncbi:MAG: tol-pal system protein YbgF [Acidobacteriota bacterium]